MHQRHRSPFASIPNHLLSLSLLLVAGACSDDTQQPETVVTPSPDPAQVDIGVLSITGRVVDYTTRTPLSGATVETFPPSESVQTRPDGSYVITRGLEEDTIYTVRASVPTHVANTTSVRTTRVQERGIDFLLISKDEGLPALFAPQGLFITHTKHSVSGKLYNESNQELRWCIPNNPTFRVSPSFGTLQADEAIQLKISLSTDAYPFEGATVSGLNTSRETLVIEGIEPGQKRDLCQTRTSSPENTKKLALNLAATLNADDPYEITIRALGQQGVSPSCSDEENDAPCTFEASAIGQFQTQVLSSTSQQPIVGARVILSVRHTDTENTGQENLEIIRTEATTDTNGMVTQTFRTPQHLNVPTQFTATASLDTIKALGPPPLPGARSPSKTRTFIVNPKTVDSFILDVASSNNQGDDSDPHILTNRTTPLHITAMRKGEKLVTDSNITLGLDGLRDSASVQINSIGASGESKNIDNIDLIDGEAWIEIEYLGSVTHDVNGEPLDNIDAGPFQITVTENRPPTVEQPLVREEATFGFEIREEDALERFIVTLESSDRQGREEDPHILNTRTATLRIVARSNAGLEPDPDTPNARIDLSSLGAVRINGVEAQSATIDLTDNEGRVDIEYIDVPTHAPDGRPFPEIAADLRTILVTEDTDTPTVVETVYVQLEVQHEGMNLELRIIDRADNQRVEGTTINAAHCQHLNAQARVLLNNPLDRYPERIGTLTARTFADNTPSFGNPKSLLLLPPNTPDEDGWENVGQNIFMDQLNNNEGLWTISTSTEDVFFRLDNQAIFTLEGTGLLEDIRGVQVRIYEDGDISNPDTLNLVSNTTPVGSPVLIRIDSRDSAGCNRARNIAIEVTPPARQSLCPAALEHGCPAFDISEGLGAATDLWDASNQSIGTPNGLPTPFWVRFRGFYPGEYTLNSSYRVAGNNQSQTDTIQCELGESSTSAAGMYVDVTKHGTAHPDPFTEGGTPLEGDAYVFDAYGNHLGGWEVFTFAELCPQSTSDLCISRFLENRSLGITNPSVSFQLSSPLEHSYQIEEENVLSVEQVPQELRIFTQPSFRDGGQFPIGFYAQHPNSQQRFGTLGKFWIFPNLQRPQNSNILIQSAVDTEDPTWTDVDFGNQVTFSPNQDALIRVCLRDPSGPLRTIDNSIAHNADPTPPNPRDQNILIALAEISPPTVGEAIFSQEGESCSVFRQIDGVDYGTQLTPEPPSVLSCRQTPDPQADGVCVVFAFQTPNIIGPHTVSVLGQLPTPSEDPLHGYLEALIPQRVPVADFALNISAD